MGNRQNRDFFIFKVNFLHEEKYFLSGFFFAASYDSLLARKHNNMPSKLICGAGSSFKSQNVEYLAFIDRAPHMQSKYASAFSKYKLFRKIHLKSLIINGF